MLIDRLSATHLSLLAFADSPRFVTGSEIGVTLDLPPPFSQIECRGRVEWSGDEAGLTSLRLSFTHMSHATLEQIAAFVRESPQEILYIDRRPQLEAHAADLHRTVWVKSAEDALEHLGSHEAAVLVLGSFDDLTPEHLLTQTLRLNSCRPAIIALDSETRAAADFVVDADFAQLSASAQREQLQRLITRAVADYCRRFEQRHARAKIIGSSDSMRHTLREVAAMSESDWSVHISGESGTGKELLARALHQESRRRDEPFVAFNCAGVTETLLQATLFGHERGAVSGAEKPRPGLFVEANGGTLFLDEIADCSGAVQASLLRVLQEREVTPLGSHAPRKINVRIISATNRDLEKEVKAGRFRADLFYRLFVLHLPLAPLRERQGDVVQLAEHFATQYGDECGKNVRGLAEEAREAIARYAWPGNVRELQNEIQRAIVRTPKGEAITLNALSARVREAAPATSALPFDAAVSALERSLIGNALTQADGNVSKAATLLGMDKSRLAKMKRRLGL